MARLVGQPAVHVLKRESDESAEDDLRLPRNGRADCGWSRSGGHIAGEEPGMGIELKGSSHLSVLQRLRKGQAQNSTVIQGDLLIARENLRDVRTVLDRPCLQRYIYIHE